MSDFLDDIAEAVKLHNRVVVWYEDIAKAGYSPETAQGLLIQRGFSVERRHNAQALIVYGGD